MPTPLALLGLNSRVSRRILAWLLAVGLAGTLAVSLLQARSTYQDRLHELGGDLQALADAVAPAMASAAWTFDRALIATQLDVYARLSGVSAVELTLAGQPAQRRGATIATGQGLRGSVPLVHLDDGQPRQLGTLTLINDLQLEQARLRDKMLSGFVGNALVILLSALGSVAIYQLIVTRRLVALARQLRGVTAAQLRALPAAPAAPAVSGARDELDELAASVATLQATGRQALLDSDNEHALLRSLMDGIPDLVWMKDSDGVYLACNPRFEKFFGAREADIVGRDDYAFMDRAQADFFRQNDRLAVQAAGPRSNEEWLDFADGGYRGLFETIKTPVRMGPDGRVGVLGIARDVTEQRQAVQALAEREVLFRTIFNEAADGILLVDPASGAFVEYNDAACRQLGRTREALAAMTLFELLLPDMKPQATADWLAGTLTDGRSQLQHRHVRPDGSVRHGLVSASAVSLRGRTLVTMLWNDVSQHKVAEDAIREERQVRQTIMESIPGVFYAIDAAGCMVFWNRNFELATGRSARQLARMPAAELFEGEHRRAVIGRIREVFERGESVVEADLHTADGLQLPYLFTGRRISIAGQPMLVGTGIDISARRHAEEELQQLNARLEQRVLERTADLRTAHDQLLQTQFALESVGMGISWVDFHSGRFVYVNRHMAAALGYSVEEMLTLRVPDIDPHFQSSQYAEQSAAIRDAGHLIFETEHRCRSGRLLPVEMSIYFQAVQGDTAPRFIAFSTDISRRRHIEQALRRAKEDAESASRAKSAFLANMSHEIRTPMNAIIGLTHLMRQSELSAAQLDKLVKIDASGRHLLSIINDILDLAKIEAGRLELDSTDFHLSSVLDNVASIVRESARDKGLQVLTDTDSVPIWLRGDPTRLRQALLNFAGNAVKFTERGHVRIAAELLNEADGELQVRFQVSDTGIGIAADKLELLFNEFAQTDTSLTRRHGGTGLGLAITRRLALLMKGEVGVHSSLGAGSTFWFTARLHRGRGIMPAAPGPDLPTPEPWLALRHMDAHVLLVEDNPINREVAQQLLHGSHLEVDTAEDGQQAVQQARQRRYDLVLMDMQMPVMDGLQATRELRRLPGWDKVPIVAMTANAFEEDRQACLQAGMDDFLSKPVEAAALHGMLLRWLKADDAPGAAPAATRDHAAAPPARPGSLALQRSGSEPAAAPRGGPEQVTTPAGAEPPQAQAIVLRRLAELPGMDVARGVATCLGRRDRYLDLLGRLMALQDQAQGQLKNALAEGDHAAARYLSHNLKGAASALGADALAGQAAALENLLRDGQPQGPAGPTPAELAAAIGHSLQSLNQILGRAA